MQSAFVATYPSASHLNGHKELILDTGDRLAAGYRLQLAGNLAEAEACYREVLDRSPGDADAWCYLGMVCHDAGRYGDAEHAHLRSLECDPEKSVTWNNLANTLTQQERLRESARCLMRALALQPEYASAHHNLAVVLYRLGRLQEAIERCRQAVALAPDNARMHQDLGIMLLLHGDWQAGWPEYASRFRTGDLPPGREGLPLWDGSDLSGRTVLLEAEQGLGDTIQFVRYARKLKQLASCEIVLEAPARMHSLLSTCRGIDRLVRKSDDVRADCRAPLLDLPGLLRETPDTVFAEDSYLGVAPERVDAWRNIAADRNVRIGLVWQGGSDYAGSVLRNLPLRALSAFRRLDGVTLYSLQRAEADSSGQAGNRLVIQRPGDGVDEEAAFVDTAAIMRHLDLVISVDTSVAHLAGALGVPVWLALAHVPDWRWGMAGDSTRWYPSMRLFRQPRRGDWRSVGEAMAEAVIDAFPERVTRRPAEAMDVTVAGGTVLKDTRYGLMMLPRNDLYVGRSIDEYGEFSRGETELFRSLLSPGSVIVEAGANLGAHTLALADMADRHGVVHAFEPQASIFQMLCANVRMNGIENVRCHAQALGASRGTVRVPRLDLMAEQNFGGLSLEGSQSGDIVERTTIDHLGLTRLDLLKADVEGMELAVLEGAAKTIERCRPILYVENDRAGKSPALIRHIQSLGYRLYWHIVRLYDPANFYRNPDNHFEGVVSVNMLCVHRGANLRIEGLREVDDADDTWRTAE